MPSAPIIAKVGAKWMKTRGRKNANGRAADFAVNVHLWIDQLAVKIGASNMTHPWQKNVFGKAVRNAPNARSPRSRVLQKRRMGARSGALATAMIGLQNAHGKVASRAAIATRDVVCRGQAVIRSL